MRRLAAALIASTLLLAACSPGDEPEEPLTSEEQETGDPGTQEPTAEDVAALEAVTVEGEVGTEPTLTFDTPFTVANPVARVETPGDGETLAGGQRLELHAVTYSGEDGELLDSTWQREQTDALPLGDPQIFPAITEALVGQQVGVRVLFASPAMEESEFSQGMPVRIMALEVVEAREVPTRAEGEAVEPAEGLPTVTLAEDGEPSVEIPEGYEAPDELVAQTLIEGSGETVQAGQTLTAHYTGWTLDGEVFDSSWARDQPADFGIGTGQVIAGWDEGLVGATIGSQVLLVIPSDQAYGDSEHALAGETLIFVVDVLDAG